MLVDSASLAEYKYDVFVSYSHIDKEWVQGELLLEIHRRADAPLGGADSVKIPNAQYF